MDERRSLEGVHDRYTLCDGYLIVTLPTISPWVSSERVKMKMKEDVVVRCKTNGLSKEVEILYIH
jgi:hypothetical protein